MLKGVQFVIDDRGEKTAVVIDLRKHRDLWEDFCDRAVARQRESEARESLASVRQRLSRRGKFRRDACMRSRSPARHDASWKPSSHGSSPAFSLGSRVLRSNRAPRERRSCRVPDSFGASASVTTESCTASTTDSVWWTSFVYGTGATCTARWPADPRMQPMRRRAARG